ncbi:MAG: monoamine oxidase [Thermoleophilaceae bacterium]|nr:monoamine oxidase [Thermoleophilaceae bacterium]
MGAERSPGGLAAAGRGWWPSLIDRRKRRRRRADVAVVGGGLSGLVAADRLARSGASVVVLEARTGRVGGRLESTELLGSRADLGGAWVGAHHSRLRALIDELGLETFPAPDGGERVVVRARGRASRVQRSRTARGVVAALRRLDELCEDMPLDDPLSWPPAAALDRRGLDSWLAQASRYGHARAVVRDMFVNVIASEPESVSLLHALWYARAGGGLGSLVATAGGAQQDLVAGGAHAIAERLALRLGDSVELGTPVTAVKRGSAGVVVIADGLTVDAASVVLAVSPELAERIDFGADTPPPRRPPFRTGDAIKCVVAYDTAFWREDGRSGWAWGDALPFSFTHDVSPPGGEPGLLAVFFVGDRARRLRELPAGRRDAAVADGLCTAFGPWAQHPVAFATRDWTADPWALGGYGSSVPPGAWTAAPHPAGDPAGRVVWAGTESAVEHHGYMEGAVRAGERAAVASLQLA